MKIRKTLLFWVVLLITIIGIPVGINWAIQSGMEEVVGYLTLGLVLVSLVVLAIEQALVQGYRMNIWGALVLDASILLGVLAVFVSIVS